MTAERDDADDLGEVILEYVPVGAIVRVTALHAASLTEVTIQGPAVTGEGALRRLALQKLRYVLRKQGQ